MYWGLSSMQILTQDSSKREVLQWSHFKALIIQLKMCFGGPHFSRLEIRSWMELIKMHQMFQSHVSRMHLGGTGDILVVALCRQAWARSHGVPFCCLRSSNAAAAVVFPSPHCRTAMADSASESDTDGAGSSSATPMSSSASNSGKPSIVISQFRLEELTNRLASLQQENKVLKIELETFKLKCKALQEENRDLRKASVTIVSNVS